MEKDIIIEETTKISELDNKEENISETDNIVDNATELGTLKKAIKYTSITYRVICALMPIAAIFIIYALASPVAFTKHEMIGDMDYRTKDMATIMNMCLIYCVFNLIMMIGVWSISAYYKKKLKSFNDISYNNKEETTNMDTDPEVEEDIKESEIEIISKDMSKLYNQLVVKFILNFVFGAMLLIVNWKINIG